MAKINNVVLPTDINVETRDTAGDFTPSKLPGGDDPYGNKAVETAIDKVNRQNKGYLTKPTKPQKKAEEELAGEHKKALEELTSKQEAKEKELTSRHERELAELKEKQEGEAAKLKGEQTAATDKLTSTQDEAMSKMVTSHTAARKKHVKEKIKAAAEKEAGKSKTIIAENKARIQQALETAYGSVLNSDILSAHPEIIDFLALNYNVEKTLNKKSNGDAVTLQSRDDNKQKITISSDSVQGPEHMSFKDAFGVVLLTNLNTKYTTADKVTFGQTKSNSRISMDTSSAWNNALINAADRLQRSLWEKDSPLTIFNVAPPARRALSIRKLFDRRRIKKAIQAAKDFSKTAQYGVIAGTVKPIDVNLDNAEPAEEVVAEAETEADAAPTEEVVAEAETEADAAPTEEVVAEAEIEADAEPTEEVVAEAEADAEPTKEVVAEAETEADAEPTEEVVAEAETEADAEPTEEVVAEAEIEADAEPTEEVVAEAEAETEADAEPTEEEKPTALVLTQPVAHRAPQPNM